MTFYQVIKLRVWVNIREEIAFDHWPASAPCQKIYIEKATQEMRQSTGANDLILPQPSCVNEGFLKMIGGKLRLVRC
jgi:hypothetical protein